MNPVTILIRTIVLAVVVPVAGWLFDLATTAGDSSGGAKIGAGLFAFAVGAALALAWGLFDGRRRGVSLMALIGRWALASALAALLGWVGLWVREGYDATTALSDLTTVTPFVFTTLLGPAVLGVLIGWATRPAAPPDPAAPEPA